MFLDEGRKSHSFLQEESAVGLMVISVMSFWWPPHSSLSPPPRLYTILLNWVQWRATTAGPCVLNGWRCQWIAATRLASLPLHGCCWPEQTLQGVHVCFDVTHAGRGRRGRTPASHSGGSGGSTLLSSATSTPDASDAGAFSHPGRAAWQANWLWSFRCCLVREWHFKRI